MVFIIGNIIVQIFSKIFFVILMLSVTLLILNMFKNKISIGPIKKPNGKYKFGLLKNGQPICWQNHKQ